MGYYSTPHSGQARPAVEASAGSDQTCAPVSAKAEVGTMEFIPTKKIVYDGDKMAAATPAVARD